MEKIYSESEKCRKIVHFQISQPRGFKFDILSINESPSSFGRHLLIYFYESWSQDKIQQKSIPKSGKCLLKLFPEKMQTIDTGNSDFVYYDSLWLSIVS
ncbi:MAG: hypothetical protein HQM08_06460 [Candidatus Riflebacteria bacterium]|nr:hypothetical protein [Candidatus Riflebacteria bacterium]